MRTARLMLLPLIAGVLLGCGSSPPVRFYALDSMTASFETADEGAIVGIGPLSFPDYLKRPQIITRSSGARLEVAEFDRWAEPLDAAFRRSLAANIDALLTDAMVIEFPFGGGRISPDYRLMAQIARFDVGPDRVAVLDVRWAIGTGEGDGVVAPRRSNDRAPAPVDGYEGVVLALQEALEAFSRDVVAALREATDV